MTSKTGPLICVSHELLRLYNIAVGGARGLGEE